MQKRGWVLIVAGMAAACGDNNDVHRLEITDPVAPSGGVKQLCLVNDNSNVLAGLQYNVVVSAPGFADGEIVNISIDDAAPDPQVGQPVADNAVTFSDFTIPEGEHSLQARSENGSIRSDEVSVEVITTPPAVTITSPTDLSSILADDDVDTGTPGIQIDVQVDVAVEDGQEVTLTLTPPNGNATSEPPVTASGGHATFRVTLSANGSWGLRVDTTTACGNPGTTEIHVGVGGCAIALTSPTETVTTDSSAGTPGVQSNVVYAIGAECAGKTVTLTGCDVVVTAPLTVTATAGGAPIATFADVTLCAQDVCPLSTRTCIAEVTNDLGNTSMLTSMISVDTQPPLLVLETFQPPNRCGGTVTAAEDVDTVTAGTQVRMQLSGVAAEKWIEVDGTRVELENDAFANVTIDMDGTTMVGKGTDAAGNIGETEPCIVTLGALGIGITDPDDNELLGADDGTVVGETLSISVTGTVSDPTATVVVRVDNQTAGQVNAVVDAEGNWVATGVIVPVGEHTISAIGTISGGGTGTASITVTVDLDAPPDPLNYVVTPLRRNAVQVTWNAPDDGSGGQIARCEIRTSTVAIADVAAWEALPVGVSVAGVPEGTPMSALITPLKSGRPLFFGLRCFDAPGNGSQVVQNALPGLTLAFTQSAALVPAAVTGFDVTSATLGVGATGADLNGDGFNDLVVGAPTACRTTQCDPGVILGPGLVYVFMGSATGIATTPSFVIRGNETDGNELFGNSIVTLDWNQDGVDDVAIGAPLAVGTLGQVFVFLGGSASWTPGASLTVLDDTDADVIMTPNDPAPGDLNGFVGFGAQLTALDFDGDGARDLAIGAQGTRTFAGSVVIVHTPPAQTPVRSAIAIPGDLAAAGTTGVEIQFDGALAYGTVVGALGSVNGDAFDDLGVGPASLQDPGVTVSAKIVYGRAQTAAPFTRLPESSEVRETIIAPNTSNLSTYPEQLGSIGDINGDGRRDIMGGDSSEGRVFVTPGGSTAPVQLPGGAILVFQGQDLSNLVGGGLANNAAGLGADVDGDGVEDLATGGRNSRALHIWYGGETPFNPGGDDAEPGPAQITRVTGTFWLGDTNGDGLADLILCDAQNQMTPPGPGAVVVLR